MLVSASFFEPFLFHCLGGANILFLFGVCSACVCSQSLRPEGPITTDGESPS